MGYCHSAKTNKACLHSATTLCGRGRSDGAMINARDLWRVQIGSRVRLTGDSEALIVLSSHQEPDGGVKLRCLRQSSLKYVTVQGSKLELVA